ncbi:MAG TPA: glycosyltransferase, partial [Nitrospiria bacterium]|nr:glycosyltransferase [Nitrospiria bacterium]
MAGSPKPLVSAIIPVLNEEDTIPKLLGSLRHENRIETIVVDGGSSDGTVVRSGGRADKVLTVTGGRAKQLNGGAAEAS